MSEDSRLRRELGRDGQRGIETERARRGALAEMFGVEAASVKLGRYVVGEQIGAGAMGVVYAGTDPDLDRDVAIKVLHRLPDTPDRFLLEARALAQLSHPNITQLYDAGERDGRLYLVMELVRGSNLRTWVDRDPPHRARHGALISAGRGLAAVHDAGLIHGDFKPDNVLVGENGDIKVVDFGLARPSSSDSGGGTAVYMAPECLEGDAGSARSDQFSFAVSAFEVLSGKRPFAGRSRAALLDSIVRSDFQDAGGKIPHRTLDALQRALDPDPARRFGSMDELLRAFDRRRRRLGWLASLSIVGVAAGAVAVVYPASPPCPDPAHGFATVWNENARARLRDTFAQSGVAGHEHAFNDVSRRLDAFTGRWGEQHASACSAGNLDRRMACLRRVKDGAAALVALLRDADADRVRNAGAAVGALPRPQLCSDPIAANAPPPPPDVERLGPRLAEVDSAVALDEIDRASDLLTALLADAEGVTHPPFVVRLLRTKGLVLRYRAEYEAAAAALEEAFFAATEIDDAEVMFTTAIVRADVCGELRDPTCTRTWTTHARSAADRMGAGPREETMLGLSESSALIVEGRFADALETAEGAYAIASVGDESLRTHVQTIRNRIALALDGLGRYQEAIAWQEQTVAELTAVDPEHPGLYTVLANMTLDLIEVDELDRARALGMRARSIAIAHHGAEHVYTGHAEQNLAAVAGTAGDWPTVAVHLNAAEKILRAALGPDHPDLARVESNLGLVATEAGDAAVAIRHHREAVRISTAVHGANHPETALFRATAGEALLIAGEPEQARAELERAMATFGKVWPADHPELALPLNNLGLALTELGRAREAVLVIERALAIAEGGGASKSHLTLIREALARAKGSL